MFTLLKGYQYDEVPKKIFHHIHLPKCGGTTIDHIFKRFSFVSSNFHFFRFKYVNSENSDLNKLFLNENKFFFISGHTEENFLDTINKNIFKFSIIREPVQRLISHYKYELFKNNKTPKDLVIKKFIENQALQNKDNLMVRTFANVLDKDVVIDQNIAKNAVKNLMKLDLLANLENWNILTNILISILNLPNILYSKFQKKNYNFEFIPSEEEKNLVKAANFFDIKVYNEIFAKKDLFFNKKINLNVERINKNYLIVSPLFVNKDNFNYLLNDKNYEELVSKFNIKIET